MIKKTSLALLLLAISFTAGAQSSASAPSQGTAGIMHLCGGVSTEDSSAMKATAKDYDLMLTFASQNGAYLADAKVDISDSGGRPLLQTTCSGPIMLVRFPQAGSYRIQADIGGNTQVKTVQVQPKGGTHEVKFAWPGNPAGAEPASAR